jgi:hypothetical protein
MKQFPQYVERPSRPGDQYELVTAAEARQQGRKTPPTGAILFAIVVALVIIAIAGWLVMTDSPARGAADHAAVPSAQPGPAVPQRKAVEKSPPVPTNVNQDGMYIVGKQIRIGTYRTTCGTRSTCVWQRYQAIGGVVTQVAGGTALPGQSVLVEISKADFSVGVLGFGSWTIQ